MEGIHMKKKILLMLSACVIVLSMTSCTIPNMSTSQTNGETESQVADSTPESTGSEQKSSQDSSKKTEKKTYAIGETWTVDGQWSVTVNSVTETSDRNQFSEKTPNAVYVVDYTYTNIGYESEYMDGLYISLDDGIVDSAGVMGYSYPGDIVNYPQAAPVGATCNAQACIGVDNPGSFKINFSQYDGNNEKHSAVFDVAVQ